MIFGFCIADGATARTELEKLWQSAAAMNGEVLAAQAAYDAARLSASTLNGIYAPSLSASTSASIDEDYSRRDIPKTLSPSLSFTQPLPGGASVGITGTYNVSAASASGKQYITQTPEITLTLSQSLLPFWLQGKKRNPEKLSLEQKQQYYYQQLLYTRQQKIQSTTQYYILCQIYKKKVQVYEASIAYRQQQADAYNALKRAGKASLVNVAEAESSLFTDRQNLYETQLLYEQYLAALKDACGTDAELSDTDLPAAEDKSYLHLFGGIKDPCAVSLLANVEAADTARILNRQKGAPVLSLSFTADYAMEPVEAGKWLRAWNDGGQKSWSAGISIDMAPFFSAGISKSRQQDEIAGSSARDAYHAYIRQRHCVSRQYESLLASFRQQLPHAEELCQEAEQLLADFEKRYKAGAISALDYEGYRFQALSAKAARDCISLYLWLYTWLAEAYS